MTDSMIVSPTGQRNNGATMGEMLNAGASGFDRALARAHTSPVLPLAVSLRRPGVERIPPARRDTQEAGAGRYGAARRAGTQLANVTKTEPNAGDHEPPDLDESAPTDPPRPNDDDTVATQDEMAGDDPDQALGSVSTLRDADDPSTSQRNVAAPAQAEASAVMRSAAVLNALTTTAPTVANSAPATAANQSPASPATPLQVFSGEDRANLARVVRGIANAVNQNGGSITLRLQPPDLGFVRVTLEIEDGTVRAVFQAEPPSVRTLLHQQMTHLRLALESHGLQVGRLNVQTMQSEDNSTDTRQQDGQTPTDGRSRGAFGESSLENEQQEDDAFEAAEVPHAAPGVEPALNAVA